MKDRRVALGATGAMSCGSSVALRSSGRRGRGTRSACPGGPARRWFPFDVVGERANQRAAALRVPRRRGRGLRGNDGRVLAAVSDGAALGGRTRRLRPRAAPAGDGCELTLINRFDELGKAARDAAGWHACLDVRRRPWRARRLTRRALGRGAPGLRLDASARRPRRSGRRLTRSSVGFSRTTRETRRSRGA